MIESTGSHHRRSCNAERLITWILNSHKNFDLLVKILWVCFKKEIDVESTFQIHLINVCRYEKVVFCQVLLNSPTFYLDQGLLKQSLTFQWWYRLLSSNYFKEAEDIPCSAARWWQCSASLCSASPGPQLRTLPAGIGGHGGHGGSNTIVIGCSDIRHCLSCKHFVQDLVDYIL